MFKNVLYNTGAQTLAKGISASTTLIVTLIIGRFLGPAGFGDFTKIFTFIGFFHTFADFGANQIFIKNSAEKSTSHLFRTLLAFRLIYAILLTLIAIIVSLALPYNPAASTGFSPIVKIGIIIASTTILTQALFTTANALFQKKLRYDLSAIATTAGSLVILATTVAVSISQKSVLQYVFAYTLAGATYVAVAFYLIVKKFAQKILPTLNKQELKSLAIESFPIGAALILNLIYFRLDIFILASVRSSTEVGLYGLAYQFFQASLAIPIFFANALYPQLIVAYNNSLTEFKKQIKSWTIYLSGFSIALMILMFALSYLIPIIYDSRFAESGISLRILSLGMPFFFLSALFWHLIIIFGKQKFLIYIYGAGAGFNLIANLTFIPKFGFIAASYITVVSEALVLFFSIFALYLVALDRVRQ